LRKWRRPLQPAALTCLLVLAAGRPAAPAPSGLHPASGAAGWRLGV